MTPQRAAPCEGRPGAGEIRRVLLESQDGDAAWERRETLESRLDALMAHGVDVRIAVVAVRSIPGTVLDEDALDSLVELMQGRLLRLVPPEDSAGMAFGEFLIQLPDDGERARMLLDALRREFTEPYELIGTLPGIDIRLTATQSPEDGVTLDALLRAADRALGGESVQQDVVEGNN